MHVAMKLGLAMSILSVQLFGAFPAPALTGVLVHHEPLEDPIAFRNSMLYKGSLEVTCKLLLTPQ